MESSFNLPGDMSELSAEDIQGLLETARAEFSALYESDDVSNEALEEMQRLADGIESVVGEQNIRLAAARRVELAAQVEASSEEVEELAEDESVELSEEEVIEASLEEVEVEPIV